MCAHLPHTILDRALWVTALRYAQALKPGDEIHESIDGAYIAPFKGLLPLALEAHGLRLDGTVVVKINEMEGRT